MSKQHRVDKPFLVSVVILIVFGFFIFSSASLGLLARGGEQYSNVAFSQTFFGLFLGTIAMVVISRIPFKVWRKYSFWIFLLAVAMTLLVFTSLGFEHAGARRWLFIGDFSFQPSEFLKFAFIVYFAALISAAKEKVGTVKFGLLPFLILISIVGAILLAQPDTDTFAVILAAGVAIFLISGGKWRHIVPLLIIAILGLFLIASVRPYVKQRIVTFIQPAENSLSSGYQIQQSLIAIGSGGVFGRGFGQSVQKFNFLPEPISDSIFAVAAEEFGLLGGIALIFLFLYFAFRGLKIAVRVEDTFGRLMVVGIVILIVAQAYLNIGAMLGVLPLTGIPLPFVSHGGTALMFTLAEVGIILNVSRYQKLASRDRV
jgi:cell division protein FtsW